MDPLVLEENQKKCKFRKFLSIDNFIAQNMLITTYMLWHFWYSALLSLLCLSFLLMKGDWTVDSSSQYSLPVNK